MSKEKQMKMDVQQLVTVQVSRNRSIIIRSSVQQKRISNSLFSSDICTNYYIKITRYLVMSGKMKEGVKGNQAPSIVDQELRRKLGIVRMAPSIFAQLKTS